MKRTEISKNSMYEVQNENFKITVEERSDDMYIATYWDKNMELEQDRQVYEFETHGGAAYQALVLLAEAQGLELHW